MTLRNRAKCKLCNSIIESFHSTDYVLCKCGEIAVDGGEAMRCIAKDFKNFLRVDDEGNEIVVKVIEDKKQLEELKKPSKDDLCKMVDDMIEGYERLPSNALHLPATSADVLSVLYLLRALYSS